MTIMSRSCAERCNLLRLMDRRWQGMAVGVGSAKILGALVNLEQGIGELGEGPCNGPGSAASCPPGNGRASLTDCMPGRTHLPPSPAGRIHMVQLKAGSHFFPVRCCCALLWAAALPAVA